MALKNRVRFSSTIDRELANKLKELSDKTNIDQSKLVDQAIQLILNYYKDYTPFGTD